MTKKKVYFSFLREAQTMKRRREIVAEAILLLKRDSPSFSLRQLGRCCGVSERHLYRLFKGLEGLAEEIHFEMTRKMGLEDFVENLNRDNLVEWTVRVHRSFNVEAELMTAYLKADLDRRIPAVWKREREAKIERLFQESNWPSDRKSEMKIKMFKMLFSARYWLLLKTEAGMNDEEHLRHARELATHFAR